MLKLLHKKLLKYKLKKHILISNNSSNNLNKDAISCVIAILASCELAHLEDLLLSIKSNGGVCNCIELNMDNSYDDIKIKFQIFAMCKAFRWSKLSLTTKLQQVPYCNSCTSCLNPYHYTQWKDLQEISFPKISSNSSNENENMEKRVSKKYSLNSDDDDVMTTKPRNLFPSSVDFDKSLSWCRILYWEEKRRIGRQYLVRGDYVNVFNHLPHGDGLCLSAIARSGGLFDSEISSYSSCHVRHNIGYGITLALGRLGDVILHNRSQYSVFVQSQTIGKEIDAVSRAAEQIYKLEAGKCAQVFDFDAAFHLKFRQQRFDPSVVRLSFIKGWGSPEYKRPCLLSCPCWLEVFFDLNICYDHFN